MRLFFRTLLISLPRFLALIASVVILQYVDVSPLPFWTLVVFSYAVHFALTFAFAKWVFYHRAPSWGQTSLVASLFVILEMVYESGLYIFYNILLHRDWSQLWQGYQWQTWVVAGVYVLAVILAAAHSRRHHASGVEGLEV